MKGHVDLAVFPLIMVCSFYLFGVMSFETTVVLQLTFGLPYGGPP